MSDGAEEYLTFGLCDRPDLLELGLDVRKHLHIASVSHTGPNEAVCSFYSVDSSSDKTGMPTLEVIGDSATIVQNILGMLHERQRVLDENSLPGTQSCYICSLGKGKYLSDFRSLSDNAISTAEAPIQQIDPSLAAYGAGHAVELVGSEGPSATNGSSGAIEGAL